MWVGSLLIMSKVYSHSKSLNSNQLLFIVCLFIVVVCVSQTLPVTVSEYHPTDEVSVTYDIITSRSLV